MDKNKKLKKMVGYYGKGGPTDTASQSIDDYNRMIRKISEGYKKPTTTSPRYNDKAGGWNPFYWGAKGLDMAFNAGAKGFSRLKSAFKKK